MLALGPIIGGGAQGVGEGMDQAAKRELERAQGLAKLYEIERSKQRAPLDDAYTRAQIQHLQMRPQWQQQQDQQNQAIRALLQFGQGSGQMQAMPQPLQASPFQGAQTAQVQPQQGGVGASLPPMAAQPMGPSGMPTMPPQQPQLPPPIQGAGTVPQQPQPPNLGYPPEVVDVGKRIASQYGYGVAKQAMDQVMFERARQNQDALRQSQLQLAESRLAESQRKTDIGHEDRAAGRASRESIADQNRISREDLAERKFQAIPEAERNREFRTFQAGLMRQPGITPEQMNKQLAEKKAELGLGEHALTYNALQTMSTDEMDHLNAAMKDIFDSAGTTRKSTEGPLGYVGLSHEQSPNYVDKRVKIGNYTFRVYGYATPPDAQHFELVKQ